MTGDQMATLQPALREYLESFADCFRKQVTFGYLETYVAGLMSDIKRKSIEPIALAAQVPVRTMQEFLSSFRWDHKRAEVLLHHKVADRGTVAGGIGVIDGCGHSKSGDKTPGVQRQWCGEVGKIDNCVVGQHLLYTDNDPVNPFGCILCSDLFVPQSWAEDQARRREARIPDELVFRKKWEIALDQVARAVGNGVKFSYFVCDAEYGSVPGFWFGLDSMGQLGVGEVRSIFQCWATPPSCNSQRPEHSPHQVQDLARHSPAFYDQKWTKVTVKDTTRGPMQLRYKAARVQLTNTAEGMCIPTDKRYWLIVAQSIDTKEIRYFLSNAPQSTPVEELLGVAFSRWHIEQWFERAKQETGFGAFEVRTYDGLIRHWLCSRMAMYFLADQTQRLRGEKSAHNGRAGSHSGQHSGGKSMENMAAILVGNNQGQPVLSVP